MPKYRRAKRRMKKARREGLAAAARDDPGPIFAAIAWLESSRLAPGLLGVADETEAAAEGVKQPEALGAFRGLVAGRWTYVVLEDVRGPILKVREAGEGFRRPAELTLHLVHPDDRARVSAVVSIHPAARDRSEWVYGNEPGGIEFDGERTLGFDAHAH